MQNAKNKKNVVITTPKTLSASAKTTTAMTTDVVDFEIELEVLTILMKKIISNKKQD